ncbi:hypothetical protein A5707_12145 [Mycobacterium kyorinense]|uniref:DUF4333 domain-containing protein n=2 Tax=Mycobacterium kyorinense TaxID=487514 RepID=A0A1A2ZUB7_9MYCO|nr:hypothetical protein A5707_12145 [Mycobacterium kyorinense]
MERKTRRSIVASLLGTIVLLSGCSVHGEVGKSVAVPKDKLAATVKEKLEANAGEKADSVVCDGDLPGKVGATQRCVLTDGGTKYRVTVTTTGVDGDNVKFDAVTDDQPMN